MKDVSICAKFSPFVEFKYHHVAVFERGPTLVKIISEVAANLLGEGLLESGSLKDLSEILQKGLDRAICLYARLDRLLPQLL